MKKYICGYCKAIITGPPDHFVVFHIDICGKCYNIIRSDDILNKLKEIVLVRRRLDSI